ncbi:retropepsin-like aspartic protease family protein [Limnofasciculus baicalensis]|uniref:Retroviral-like aspartic protease family protein n=1 Tax=Limnofasciculus baicalensis BBK-W-15 TaxID=2699891 RepID=A0AAE3GPR2_9CYAN|nr:retropepsin-like aspartic protease [Limnofasciculus baicalensis]MCP2727884.1 retroviral-like aspartic protease family protein [Limnofasciculus baicalensis BBK-W-15]
MPFRDRTITVMVSGTLTLIGAACSTINPPSTPNESPQPLSQSETPTPNSNSLGAAKNQAQLTIAPNQSAQEAYERALDSAYSAAVIGQSAQAPDDWRLAIARWQDAIVLLKSIPSSSSYYKLAQPKIAEYKRNLARSQAKSKLPPAPEPTPISLTNPNVQNSPNISPTPAKPKATVEITATLIPKATQTSTPTPTPNKSPQTKTETPKVFKAPVKRRIDGKAVIDVTFNGNPTFEMVADTSASGTVITAVMAKSLGVVQEAEVITETANGEGVTLPIGKVKSIAVAGAVQQNFPVAIGGTEVEVGLLGQDFYSHYNVLFRQDAIEFRPRNKS